MARHPAGDRDPSIFLSKGCIRSIGGVARSSVGTNSRQDGYPDLRDDVNESDGVAAVASADFPSQRLAVLLVSYWFPPSNVIGAVRVGHFAKCLYEAGHDVRVLTAQNAGDQSLPLGIPAEQVIYVRAPRIGEWLDPLIHPPFGLVRRVGQAARVEVSRAAPGKVSSSQAASISQPISGSMAANLRRHYYALMQFPDTYAPWMRRATAAGRKLVKHWRPDIILASAPPNSGLIAAWRIARACRAPWIADLRDLWADNSYYDHPNWRLWIDRWI